MNVRNLYGAAGGGEFNADRASHEGNADVVLAQVSDERSVDISTKNGAHVARKKSSTGHCAMSTMFNNGIIAICDDSRLGSMASESFQNP